VEFDFSQQNYADNKLQLRNTFFSKQNDFFRLIVNGFTVWTTASKLLRVSLEVLKCYPNKNIIQLFQKINIKMVIV